MYMLDILLAIAIVMVIYWSFKAGRKFERKFGNKKECAKCNNLKKEPETAS